MPLSPKRIFEGGETEFPWERDAIDFVLHELPDSDPHLAWPLHELLDPGTGRLYEIDLMVLARGGLFLIEIKSHPGVLTGDSRDWTFTESSGRQRHLACPYPATNHKAKVLASSLSYKLGNERPFVQPLVFVSGPDAEMRLSGGCPEYVTTRATIRQALVHGLSSARSRVVNRPMMRRLPDTMRQLGLQPSKASRVVAGFRLQRLLDERGGYQEHHAISTTVSDDTARVRSYLVPRATTTERRHQLERAARREAKILSRLGHHPNILSYRAYHDDGPLGPAVIFEAFEDGLPLNVFLKQEPELPFDDRLHILQAIVEAVDHCHRSEFLHRNLSPASILVRRRNGQIEVRLHRFQTAAQNDHTSIGTHHVHQLAEELDQLYQAPEVLRDPRKAQATSDVFSIGCIAWLLFTGENPAATVPDREEILREQQGLRIASVRGDLAALDGALAWATEPAEINRPDNVLEWFEGYILEDLTRPAPTEDDRRDPYQAEKGDKLGSGLEVIRVLGSGATAKVLKVSRAGRDYALKVPHDEGCAQRLVEEGKVLAHLRHEHIIQLHDTLHLGGRQCLLLDYAGLGTDDKRHSSFADLLRAEGTLSLEKARRYGDDLLSAVQYLEEQGVTHRDIKPGNLGFTTQAKKARHLTLYDFSLAAGDIKAVRAGTPEWRDPWLHTRGRWDSAADRYAVACVLYRMLAGTRAELANDGPDEGRVRIESERFDPSVRDRLRAFFEKAFTETVDDRYASAELMRSDWVGLFSKLAERRVRDTQPDSDDILPTATLSTLVEVLPLSSRARNALDRAGVVTVGHLLQLPRNHLSAIRGMGHRVAKEIVEIANLLGEHLSIVDQPPFVGEYTGPQVGLEAEAVDLSSEVVRKLQDAGVTNTVDLAHMPAEWVQRLLGTDCAKTTKVALTSLADQYTTAGTLDQWAKDFLAPKKKRKNAAEARIRTLVGLDPLPVEGGDAERETDAGARTVKQVAEAFGIEPALIHSSMHAMRRQWQNASSRPELEAALLEVLHAVGPVCTMEAAATELARIRGPGNGADPDQRTIAVGLVRLATELRSSPICWRRFGDSAWVASETTHLDALAALAIEADVLAEMEPLVSSETVRTRLAKAAAGTVLEALPPDRLLKLAAAASRNAAASARMEIYPRAMAARRALKLSLNVLSPPGLAELVIRGRVQSRYPEAQLLPARPALDDLLGEYELRFDPQTQEYLRPGIAHPTSTGTIQAPTRLSSAQPNQRRLRSPEAMEAQAFQDVLGRGVESGRFRVVQVRADHAERAAILLGDVLGVTPISLDHQVWDAMHAKARELGADPAIIVKTDREGPTSAEWAQLKELAEMAANDVVEKLLSDRAEPVLLVHPGALARFGLSDALYALSQRAQNEEGAAVVLLIPSHTDGLAPNINNQLPVPTVAGGQRLRMPESWLRNAHGAAAK